MVSPRSLPALVLAALVACGGGATEPVDPPLPQVSRIAYATDQALVFTGHTVAVRDLVKAYDAAGAELPSSMLALTLPTGWTLTSDSLHAPGTERVGGFRAAAKASATLSSSGARLALGDAPTDSTTLTAGVDLRALTLTATYTCVQATNSNGITSSDIHGTGAWPLDSLHIDGVVSDSVVYPGETGFVRNFGGIAQVYFSGRAIQYVRAPHTSVDTVPVSGMHRELFRQAPDTLVFGVASLTERMPAVKTDATTYVGVSWCDRGDGWTDTNGGRRDPVVLTAVPK